MSKKTATGAGTVRMSERALDDGRLSALFELERRARSAESLTTLRFVVANETRGVVDYRHAAVLERRLSAWQVSALADVPAADRSTPYVQWLERVVASMAPGEGGALSIRSEDLPDWERESWDELCPPSALLVPLALPDTEPVAWLWVAREADFADTERYLLEHLGEVYGHAMQALAPRRTRGKLRRWLGKRAVWLVALGVVAVVLALPVRLTALAPAEIVARDPTIVAAPMQGVVEEVLVEPNAQVEAGQPLVRLEDLEARNRFEVAQQALKVARARYRKAKQGSFDSAKSRARLGTLEAEVALRRTELRFAQRRLDQVVLKADHAGIAVFDDRAKWAGKPVRTGERILQIANPAEHELRVRLPVSDAIVLEQGARLKLFLDAHPLEPVPGEVVRTAYEPVVTPRDRLIYRVTGRLTEKRPYLRVGLRGTARIDGPRVPLAYYLFRRPITALRQMVGI